MYSVVPCGHVDILTPRKRLSLLTLSGCDGTRQHCRLKCMAYIESGGQVVSVKNMGRIEGILWQCLAKG